MQVWFKIAMPQLCQEDNYLAVAQSELAAVLEKKRTGKCDGVGSLTLHKVKQLH